MLARIFVIIGGLLVIALFAALIAPLFINWTDFRTDFEREASRIMGKPVVVHGSVDARLIPFPTVTLNDVRVGDEGDGEPLIQVAQFSMSAELAPFLSGEALIFDMRLDRPRAKLRLQPDGTLDWARGPRAAIPANTVVLENVEIADGEIEFVDEQAGRTRRVSDLSAAVSARSLAGPWKVEGRAALDGEAGSFSFMSNAVDDEGALSLRARLIPDERPFGVELDGELKVVDFRPVYAGRFTLTENRPAEEVRSGGALRINGQFQLTNESIRVPEYHFEAGPAGRSLHHHRRGDARYRQGSEVPVDRRWAADRCQPHRQFRPRGQDRPQPGSFPATAAGNDDGDCGRYSHSAGAWPSELEASGDRHRRHHRARHPSRCQT
ncbi:hypothetical protein ABIE76_004000 [Sinorhizobium fredii]